MPLRTPPLPPHPRHPWLRRGLAATIAAGLVTTAVVVAGPAFAAAPGPDDATHETASTPAPSADQVDVVDTVAPIVNAVTTPAGKAELNVEYVAPQAEASDDLDAAPATSISVTGPDGVTAPLDLATLAFTPNVDGVYSLVYQAVDAAGNVGTIQYPVAVGDASAPESAQKADALPASTADGVNDWKFSAIGDIHDNWDELKEAYDFWATQDVETTLWPGDLTNGNSEEEYSQLKDVIDSEDHYGIEHYVSLGNHDTTSGADLGDYALFETATGQRPNADYTVNGYHVITVSPGSGEFAEDADAAPGTDSSGMPTTAASGSYGYASTWLNTRLAADTAAAPEKPVFVLVHAPLRCTHYVSNEWYGSGLATGCGDNFDSLFESYPQAVVWSGHIHTPNHIPTSLWQGTQAGGGFTTVNAPPLAYYEMETGVVSSVSNDVSDSTPDDAGNNRETAIVEVDGSKVTITNYDLQADMWEPTVWEWDVAESLDTSKSYEERFPLGDARANHTAGPVWDASDAITVTNVKENTAQVDWTQAEAAPNDVHDIVQKYLVEVIDPETRETAVSFYRWSQYYVMPLPDSVGHEVWDLKPGTEYTVQITPINAWSKAGAPLTTTFTTTGESTHETSTFEDHGAAMPAADMLDIDFDTVKDVSTNPVPYALLDATGKAPATGQPAQVLVSAADKLKLVDGYTTSAAFVANGPGDVFTYGNPALVSNVMRITPLSATRGTLTDIAVIQGAEYELVRQVITYGQPYHAALRLDGANMDVWFDGKKVGGSDVSADLLAIMAAPQYDYYMVAGGSTDGTGTIVNPFDGELSVARAYSTALTDVEMARIAHQAQPSTDFVLPAVRAVSAPVGAGTAGVESSFPALESVDDSGVVAETSITVLGPSGDELGSTTGAAGAFTPELPGGYTLVYAATDGAGNENSARYSVTVAADPTVPADPTNPGDPADPADPTSPSAPTDPSGSAGASDPSDASGASQNAGALANTGNALGAPIGLALGLLLLGAVTIVVMRRRRTTS
ncbi:metallophosphoesterase [Herbiconiux sp. CPCC 205763]|uniref:Metallophosphoesterase n=1 Tax=Herbiconiux aconitum TaxID=2970913 RepID=A0ABT2GSU9_9MICO|nr:fibronectin type III domain-containing protein [Herbiconiux aconitum]MCS5719223.1 metallophosphoesterase [Herbiconiux aconitum]